MSKYNNRMYTVSMKARPNAMYDGTCTLRVAASSAGNAYDVARSRFNLTHPETNVTWDIISIVEG